MEEVLERLRSFPRSSRCQIVLVVGALLLVGAIVLASVTIGLSRKEASLVVTGEGGVHPAVLTDPVEAPPASKSPLGIYKKAAVAIDGEPCSKVGM